MNLIRGSVGSSALFFAIRRRIRKTNKKKKTSSTPLLPTPKPVPTPPQPVTRATPLTHFQPFATRRDDTISSERVPLFPTIVEDVRVYPEAPKAATIPPKNGQCTAVVQPPSPCLLPFLCSAYWQSFYAALSSTKHRSSRKRMWENGTPLRSCLSPTTQKYLKASDQTRSVPVGSPILSVARTAISVGETAFQEAETRHTRRRKPPTSQRAETHLACEERATTLPPVKHRLGGSGNQFMYKL